MLSYRIRLVIFNTCIKFQNPSLSGSREKSVTEISWNWSGRSYKRTKGMIIMRRLILSNMIQLVICNVVQNFVNPYCRSFLESF